MDENKEKEITLSKDDLKEVFKELMQPFTTAAEELKAVTEKSRSEEVGKDAVTGLMEANKDYAFAMQLSSHAAINKMGKLNPAVFEAKFGKKPEEILSVLDGIEKAAAPLNVTTSADGGVVVPTLTEQSIKELAVTYGQAYQDFEVMPMGQNPMVQPKESTAGTVYWVGENDTITESKEQLGSDTLTPKKVAALTAISNELLKVPSPSMGAYVTRKMGIRILTAIDNKVYQNGNTTLTGLFYSSNSFGNTVATSGTNPNTLTYDNIIDLVYSIDSAKLVGAWFRMHRTIAAIVRKLKDGAGNYIWRDGAAGTPPTILDYPVRLVEAAPNSAAAAAKPIIVLGNGMNSTLGDIGGIEYTLFNSGTISNTSLIENDLSGIRAIKQVAFTPGLLSEYTHIRTAAA